VRTPLIGIGLLGIVVVGVIFGLRPFDDEPIDDAQTETQFPNDLVPTGSQVGQQVPTSPFLTFDGEESDLTEYEGRPVVVNFWSSTCDACIAEMADFEEVFQRYSTQDDVAFVGINIGDTNSEAKELVNTAGVSYDMGRDTARAVFPGFGSIGLPTTALVNESGEILAVHTGPVSGQELSEMITEVLLA